MSLSSKLDNDLLVDPCLAAQNYPEAEEALHNFNQPDRCFCFPDIWAYYGMDGEVDFTIVEHKWVQ